MVDMIFKPAARYPADPRAVFILALSVFTGLTALLLERGPQSLESTLPNWAVLAWGVLLTVGSAVTLTGMWFQNPTGIIIEQVGSVVVSATTLFYSGIAFWILGAGALQGVGIITAWGLSCALRWFQLQALLNDAIGRAQKIAVLNDLEVQIAARVKEEKGRRRFHADEHDELGHWGP